LRCRFFESQDFDVVIVEPEMPSVAFEVRFAEIIVEKSVVLQSRMFDFVWCEVERLFEDAESLLLV